MKKIKLKYNLGLDTTEITIEGIDMMGISYVDKDCITKYTTKSSLKASL